MKKYIQSKRALIKRSSAVDATKTTTGPLNNNNNDVVTTERGSSNYNNNNNNNNNMMLERVRCQNVSVEKLPEGSTSENCMAGNTL